MSGRSHAKLFDRASIAIGVLLAFPLSNVALGDSSFTPPVPSNRPAESLFDHASAAVVKLYGPGAGREHGYGTGVLVSPDGYIVTALSLLVSTDQINVILADGRNYDGRLFRSDERRQLALIKIDASNLPFLSPHPSKHLQIGDAVFALGNWFKLAEGREAVSMNQGILSLYGPVATRRLAQQSDYAGPVLVVDAITANPGAAGGPLLDLEGHWVGLIGKIVEAESTYTRINYALPAEELMAFLGEAPTTSRPATTAPAIAASSDAGKPYTGIKLAKLGYRHVSAFVDRVRPGSPAATAGIQADDLILAIDGQRVSSAESYEDSIRDLVPGQTVPFTVKRGAQLITMDVTIGTQP